MATKQQVLEMLSRGEGCLGKASGNEPVFILRAQDKFAPLLIEEWANQVEAQRGRIPKVKEARALAHEMRAWQERNTSKAPD